MSSSEAPREKEKLLREITRYPAESFQRGEEITTLCVYGNTHLSGVEKCLAVKQYSDATLLADMNRALGKELPSMITVFSPPENTRQDFLLLVQELFWRFEKRVKEDERVADSG